MVDSSSDYDFDEGEDWTEPFESEGFEKGNLLRKNSLHNSTSCSTSKEAKAFEHERTIIHFDLDCFYAQVEMLKNPTLRSKPLGIQQKNIVVTCNYVAREFGVTKLMYVTDAKKKCPQLVLVSGEDLTEYRHMSYKISEFMKKYTPHVERLGFDENFVDATELVGWRQIDGDFKLEFFGHEYQSQERSTTSKCDCGCEQRIQIGSQVAADIREALQKELGITSCAGIAHNKVLAKLVAGTHKPNQQTSILPHQAQDLILSLPSPRCIPGIGSKMHKCLQAIGISSIKDLMSARSHVLAKELGSQTATLVSQLSFGVDPSPVIAYSPPQTFSDEDSFRCCNSYQDAEQRIRHLLNNLMKRVVEDGRVPQTVRLSIRRVQKHSNSRESRQTAVPSNAFIQFHATGSTESAEKRIFPVVMELFKRLVDPTISFHLTLINICFAKLVEKIPNLSPLSQFFSKQNVSIESCDQQTPDDDQEADINDANKSSINSMSNQEEKINIVSLKRRNANSWLPESRNIKGFFSGKVENRKTLPVVSPNEKNKSTNTLFELNMQGNTSVSYDATPSVPTCSSHHKEDSFYASENCTPSDQAGGDLKANFGTLSEEIKCDSISAPESSIQHDYEKFRSPELADVIGAKLLTQKNLIEILPASIDAQVLLALPCSLQKEILGQHGILMEETSHGRHFSLMPNTVLTRSQVQKKVRKRPLFSPKKITPNISFTGVKTAKNDVIDTQLCVGFGEQEHCNALNSNNFMNVSPPDVEVHLELKEMEKNPQMKTHNIKRQSEPKTFLKNLTSNKFPFQNKEVQSKPTASKEILTCNKSLYQESKLSTEKHTVSIESLSSQQQKVKESMEHNEILLKRERKTQEQCEMDLKSVQNTANCPLEDSDEFRIHKTCSVPLEIPLFDQNQNFQCNVNHAISHKSAQRADPGKDQHPVSAAGDSVHVRGRPLLPESVLKKLPKDISPEVFAELPNDIRGEIMAHVLMGTPVKVATNDSASRSLRCNKTSSCNLSNSKTSDNSKFSQKSLFNYFKIKDK